ncbi:glycosyltransferase [Desulfovibrio aerotolerans]|uniref:Glycosyltransferase n=1 Tax=Solidesulfovibrio aerotolerans TaxID=295255 RepID=A0A7C9IUP3_9BACT|nr:glycosyltransferase [Solidesulfovibrio aerotolerans]MYL82903.1 glycosyltransferase [Solidesulfovibrio aerotolerans]
MAGKTTLRVLVVLPMYGGSLPVGRYCASALAQLGHVVEIFEAPEFYGAFEALKTLRVTSDRLEYLENSFLQVISQAICAKVETFGPDLVLALAQAPLSRQALKRLRRDGVKTAMWFVEDFRLFTYWQAFAPYYDVFAVIQKDPFPDRLAAVGQPNALYLPMAADPAVHRPLELSAVERRTYGAEVSFMGAGYPNRRAAFAQLLDFGLGIFGSDWDGDAALAGRVRFSGRRITTEEAVRIFNAATINLNLHSSISARECVPAGDFVNPRTFELAMCGAFQLVSDRTYLPELFADDELARFGSMEALREKLAYFLAHPEERADYAARARARALAEHTYAHRMERLLAFVAERFPEWPGGREEEQAALAGLPQPLRDETAQLLRDLSLPADVTFPDLIAAVRGRQGRLTPLETSLLFLDEWQRQYGG